eukprot:snap_masked-scaffold_13-processed-gene-0.31-mRNA-1 protein AED:1.00 eAED:1.00 QI:0/0/0/0/1/1/2/0/80
MYGSADGDIFNDTVTGIEDLGIIDDVLDSTFPASAYAKINAVQSIRKITCESRFSIRMLGVLVLELKLREYCFYSDRELC